MRWCRTSHQASSNERMSTRPRSMMHDSLDHRRAVSYICAQYSQLQSLQTSIKVDHSLAEMGKCLASGSLPSMQGTMPSALAHASPLLKLYSERVLTDLVICLGKKNATNTCWSTHRAATNRLPRRASRDSDRKSRRRYDTRADSKVPRSSANGRPRDPAVSRCCAPCWRARRCRAAFRSSSSRLARALPTETPVRARRAARATRSETARWCA
jgi:hypothetical protein